MADTVLPLVKDTTDDIVEQLHAERRDLSRAALEALAIDAYRMTRITAHQLCRVLDIPSQYELDGFLTQHGVPLEYSLADFDDEAAGSARLWQKRRDELSSERNRGQHAEWGLRARAASRAPPAVRGREGVGRFLQSRRSRPKSPRLLEEAQDSQACTRGTRRAARGRAPTPDILDGYTPKESRGNRHHQGVLRRRSWPRSGGES